jgi:hypothetical protein
MDPSELLAQIEQQQARQAVKKKGEAGQEDLKKKVDDLQKKVEAA